MNKLKILLVCGFLALAWRTAGAAEILYQNDFQKAELDKTPDEFLVLDGGFAVKEADGNRFLELPGAPLDTFGVLFGPAKRDGVSVSARIYGTAKGRRFPVFGVGLNGVAGYKLKVSPAKKALEIYKGDDAMASVPMDWKSETWTLLRLRVRADGGHWKIEGKAWPQTGAEPKDWMITYDASAAPSEGRASIWGSPYSGTPIRFDDLLFTAD